jgi:hypothetical protein
LYVSIHAPGSTFGISVEAIGEFYGRSSPGCPPEQMMMSVLSPRVSLIVSACEPEPADGHDHDCAEHTAAH